MSARRPVSVVTFVVCSLASVALGQVTTSNPLDDLKAVVEEVLDAAGVAFTDQQNRELALVMEEQRRASERLFGDIMDFSGGPVRGADRDRALAGIQWMNEAFETSLTDLLTPAQHRVWTEHRAVEIRAAGGPPALRLFLDEAGVPLDARQTRLATTIYETAAGRLRRAETDGAAATAVTDIENEALVEVADVLTPPQVEAVLTAAGPGVSRGPVGGPADPGGDVGSPSQSPGPALAAPDTRFGSVVRALWALARPTAAYVGGATASGSAASSEQIAQIRINNNQFTTENFGGRGAPGFGNFGGFRGGGGRGGGGRGGRRGGGGGNIEIIERGGTGDFHGNFSFDFRDEALTATNALADNKPEFQQRNINVNISGPFIRDFLTASFTFNQNERENADTVVASTPTGNVSFGIVSPELNRSFSTNGQMQLGTSHALHFNLRYQHETSDNNGVGGFTLPERASTQTRTNINAGLREIWVISPRTLHEVSLTHFGNESTNAAVTRAERINVLDAFRSGGADRNNRRRENNYTLANLLWFEGDRLTFKTGTEIGYRTNSSFSEDGFLGTFTFSSLDDFLAGRPLGYTVTRGDPDLDTTQLEVAGFVQTDWRISRRFTFFAGLRYERQTNITDNDNVDPRVGFAYSLGSATVLRGGGGLFHQNLNLGLVQDVLRLNGIRQFDIEVNNPSYPDPFAGGEANVVPPSSRRLFAPDLSVPYQARASLSLERTLPWNISVDASYDFSRGYNRFRTINLNAPLPGETESPNPDEGRILQLESTGRSRSHSVRVGFRQRLTFLTYNARYTLSSDYDDGEGPFYVPMDSYDPDADWGRAGFSQRHRYNFGVNMEAPFGTLLTIDASGNSGRPYNITTGADGNNDLERNDRPDGVERNSADGPSFFNVDTTLSKTVGLNDRGTQLSIYASVDNVFNMVNLRNPSGVLTSRFFGIPTSASSARDAEIGMRYQF